MAHVLDSAQERRDHFEPSGQAVGPVQRADPRLRIVIAVLFAILVVAMDQIPTLIAALGLSLGVMILAKVPLGRTLKRMAMMDTFIIFMLVMLPFTIPGETIFTVFGLPASYEGLWRAIEIGLTANAVVLALMTLVGTMDSVTLGHALHRLKAPRNLVHLMMFTVRYTEVLNDEYLRLRRAMKVRGFQPCNSLHTYKTFGYLVGMMLIRALERSERILLAMKCRGFCGDFPLLCEFTFSRRDMVLGCLFVLTAALLLGLEYGHVGSY